MGETAGSDLEPGAKIGEYVVDRKLAEGGMGSVYAGHHPVIGKRVAVKVLSAQCAHIPDLVRRFVEEARAVNKIGHPNIIDIFSFGTLADARPFFVMEYLEGANLAERLEKGDLTATETRRILRQICGALEAAHRAGIVHRDLKPENIWVAAPAHEDSFAKVLDFGIAKLLDNPAGKSTQTGAAMGTPRYMAPEQCMGRPVDHRADIYSLGVILYEIFAGIVPFRGESFGELIYQHMSEPPEPPSRHRPMDPELERIILACLEKDPAKRPESAKELGRLLDLVVHEGNEPVTQLRTAIVTPRPSAAVGTTMGQSIGEVVVRPPGAGKRSAALAAAGAVALVVVVAGVLLTRNGSTAHPPAASSPAPAPPVATAPQPQPATATPTTGHLQLHIGGGPADRVSLDGHEVAKAVSVVDFGEVAAGAHLVTIEAAGRETQNSPVTITGGAPATLSISLPEAAAAPRPGGHRQPVHGSGLVRAADTEGAGAPAHAPTNKHSRAEEHGLMDENPFRKN
ncbi:MAG TPA: serine/threonine-protein kinase [Polyangia bacterium]|nr:serine/threonine-protein kinase [Polyangia bacterium]